MERKNESLKNLSFAERVVSVLVTFTNSKNYEIWKIISAMIIAQIGWQTDINNNKQVNKVKRVTDRQTDRTNYRAIYLTKKTS